VAIIKRVGMPENDSERQAISFLAERLPGDDFVLFHNLELPNPRGFPYEYDIVLVGEHAVYAIEVKHYGGTITGNEIEWELPSGQVRASPVPLANKKAKIVGDRLRRYSPVLNQVFVSSLVVLTREPVKLRIRDEQADRILPLSETPAYILDPSRLPVQTSRITHITDRICDAIMRQFTPLHRQSMIGDYDVIESLDAGDGYRTYLGRHRLLQAAPPALLKVYTLNIYADEKRQSRLRDLLNRDAEALYRLGAHPNIVRILSFSPWEADKYVLAMEWADLRSLRSALLSEQTEAVGSPLAIAQGMFAGLAHAHAHGVIHRNLRPESILVGPEQTVKLANFDMARVEDDALATIATRVAGRVDRRYAAPEVLRDPSAATVASDLYAAGKILRELVTGSPDGAVDGDLGQIVDGLTAEDAGQRYTSAQAAADDIAVLA